jgi:aminopeptidase N
VAQSVYTAPEQARLMPGPFSRAGEMVQLFSRLVGPFPYEKLSHLQSSTRFGGMENASAIFYSDNGVRRGSLGEGTVAHEIAHQWFGDAVTEREWPHVWLSEGFATYFAALWTRAARGDSAFRREMADIRRRILDDSASVTRRPVIDTIETSLLALLNRNSYEKGGFVLHMLRTEIGERAFFDGIRAYYAKHKHGTALTDDLRAEMERASGKQLGWFFDQWLRRPGYPSVQVEWAYDATTREVKVTVSQGARFGAFQMPIAIAVIDSTGVAQRVRLALPDTDGATTTARTPSATAPASVVVDPDVVALANISVVRR